jgi:hypothetical protein
MKTINIKTLSIFPSFLFLVNCQLLVDIDVPVEEPRMAMKVVLNNGLFGNDYYQFSESRFILDSRDKVGDDYLKDVSLKVYDQDGNLWDSIIPYTGSGFPLGTFVFDKKLKPEQGRTYRMVAVSPGLPIAEASFTTPLEVKNLQVTAKKVFRAGIDTTFQTTAQLNIKFQDPSSTIKNYFLIVAYLVDSAGNVLPFGIYQDYNDGAIGPIGISLNEVFSDDFGQNSEVNAVFNVVIDKSQFQTENFKIAISVFSLTEDEFRHEKTLRAFYDTDGNPFAEPVNVYSNINGGYGLFSGRSEVGGVYNLE